MASLVGQQLKDTYDSLLKTSDNDALGGTYKEITDGSGNGSNLYLGTGGNVGIGGSPSEKLHILGTNSGLRIDSGTSYTNTSTITLSNGRAKIDSEIITGTAQGDTAIRLYNRVSGGLAERMRINHFGDISFRDGSANEAFYWDASAGSLGLGTTSPSEILNVKSKGSTSDQITLTHSGNTVNIVAIGQASSHGSLILRSNSGVNKVSLSAAGNDSYILDSNVGIGTTSPSAKLEVSSGAVQFNGGGIDSTLGEAILFGNTSFPTAQKNRIRSSISASNTGNLLVLEAGNGTTGSYNDNQLVLRGDGNVGIGTTSPNSNLSVLKNQTSDTAIEVSNLGSISATTTASFLLSESAGTPKGWFRRYRDGTARVDVGYDGYLTFSSSISTTPAEHMRIDSSGNVLIGTTATPTSSAGNIVLKNGTAPTGNATDGVILYAEDVSTSSELKVRDEAGNVTTLSPHNFSLIPDGASEPMAWAYYSERDGKKINVDMLKLARMVESLTGEKLVYEQ